MLVEGQSEMVGLDLPLATLEMKGPSLEKVEADCLQRNEDDFDLVPFFFWRSPSLVSSSESFFPFQALYFSLSQQREKARTYLFIQR